MGLVLVALLPGTAAQAIWFGPGVLIQIGLAVGFALAFEALMLILRRQPLRPFLGDLSAPVAAILFALCMPPLAPWWVAAIGMFAAMVVAKHLYGGLGYNLFNPAMVGYAAVLICFPLELSRWPAAQFADATVSMGDALRAILLSVPPSAGWDAVAQPTPLDALRVGESKGLTLREVGDAAVFGQFGARGWEWVAAGHALGGLLLLSLRIIPWQVPVALLAAVVVVSTPLHLYDPDLYPGALQQLAMGGLVLAAFFIATDPVSGCTTPRGRLVFGAGVALLALAIRRWGAYPDGVAFAVLLMNCAAPWIDLHTRPRIFGEPRSGR
jgi:electron transport complex protein RnfD